MEEEYLVFSLRWWVNGWWYQWRTEIVTLFRVNYLELRETEHGVRRGGWSIPATFILGTLYNRMLKLAMQDPGIKIGSPGVQLALVPFFCGRTTDLIHASLWLSQSPVRSTNFRHLVEIKRHKFHCRQISGRSDIWFTNDCVVFFHNVILITSLELDVK